MSRNGSALTFQHVCASSARARAGVDIGVFRGELVPSQAVCLPSVLGKWAVAAKGILSASHGLKMGGIHARTVPAKVVNGQPIGDWSDCPFVGHAVSQPVVMPGKPDARISAFGMNVPGPVPASVIGLSDLAGKPELARFIWAKVKCAMNIKVYFLQTLRSAVSAEIRLLALAAAVVEAIRRFVVSTKVRFCFSRSALLARLHGLRSLCLYWDTRMACKFTDRVRYYERAKAVL